MADRIVLNTISYHGHGAIENLSLIHIFYRAESQLALIQLHDLLHAGVAGVAGTAGVGIGALGEELHVLLLHDGLHNSFFFEKV